MKLVNVRKLILLLILIVGPMTAQAQEVWTLNQCLDTAQAYNKTLKMNRNNIIIGNEREKEARANLIPKLTANADYKYFTDLPHQLMPLSTFNPTAPAGQFKEAQFGVPHNINANLQLTMPIYNPQLYGAIQNTKLASELTELQFKKSEEQVLYEITTLYYNAQLLKNQLNFIEGNLTNTNKLLKTTQLLHEQLLAKGTDVKKVQLQAEQLTTQQESLALKLNQVLDALKLNMSISLTKEITVEEAITFKNDIVYTLKDNLDNEVAKTQNQLLNSELRTLNNTTFLPSLALIASYGTSGFGYDKSPNEFLKFYPIGFAGVQLSYPLFNGTVTKRKINQKKLEINNNELQLLLIAAKNNMEIKRANGQRAVAGKAIRNTKNQILLAQTIYEQTLLQQKLGTTNLTDVLLADNALREAQQNYLSASIDYLKADLELKKLTGNIKTTHN